MVALALAGSMLVVTQSRSARQSADFTFYYAAASLVREGHPEEVYQQPALAGTIDRIAGDSAVDRRLPFNLPLAAVFPLVPLTLLPLDLAFRAWQAIGLLLMLGAVLVLQRSYPLGRAGSALGSLGLLASIPAWAVLTEAQLTPLPVLGAALVIATLRRDRPSLALAGGMLLAIKPHFLPVYLIMLVAARRRRALLAATGGAALVLLSPLLAGGLGGITAMAGNALGTNQLVPVRLTEAWVGMLAVVIPPTAMTSVSLALYIGTLVALAGRAARRAISPIMFASLAGWVGMLASPHVLPHDLLLLAAPTWLVFQLSSERRLPSPLAALLLVNLALLLDLRGIGFVAGPVAMTAATAWGVWQVRRRAARQLPQPAAAAA